MASKRPDSAQLALVDVPADDDQVDDRAKPGRRQTGRHERALNKAAKEAGLDRLAVMAAAVSAARSLAWALDRAEAKGNPYAVAQLARPYQDMLVALRLVPQDDDGGDDDPFGDLDGPA